ncbi:hypothetical protein [Nocardia sp. NBC_01388]|uniref:hypothetical protein n=1 Tax=Nocardia sp. NBC_01388 TaxID=2903596 RepID=UPI00324548CE
MPQTRTKELETEIWAAIGELLANRSRGEVLLDTSFWTAKDIRAYNSAYEAVRLAIEEKAGAAPDATAPGYKTWSKGKW